MAASCSSYSPTHISAASFSNSTMSSKRQSSSYIRAGAKLPPRVPKELHFNHDGSATKRLQAGVDMVADLVGVTLGPKGRNVVLQNKYGTPKIVNDGVTVLKQIQLEDPLENVGAKLVRQAGAKTNDLAGDGSTTSVVLAQGLIAEGLKVISVGLNPIQISRGIKKTAEALVTELKLMSKAVEDCELADVAAVSAGNDYEVGNMIAEALLKVGRQGVVTIEQGKATANTMEIVEGMQFDRGYLSEYFVTDRRKRTVEFQDCKVLLVDKNIVYPRELFKVLDDAVQKKYPVLIIAEGIEQGALAPVIKNKLRGALKAVAIKAPAFGERKSHYLDDIATLTGATVVRDDVGLVLKDVGKEVLGNAIKVVVTKDSTMIVSDGSNQSAVNERVAQLRNLVKVGAQTVVELKDKQLRIEDALNATKAAIEEGVVVGGGCCMLRLSQKIDDIKKKLENDEQKIGADIFKRALTYPTRLIAKNAGVNGSIVIEKVLSNDDYRYGYNAAKDRYEDLMAAGIIDPSKVVRCCLEHAASVAHTFLTSDLVVVEIEELIPRMPRMRTPMPTSGIPTRMRKPMPTSGIPICLSLSVNIVFLLK
ncbi:hypothetical protein MKW92_022866 [Papaver armeniacum]|nr:hypothetical protein MKW92_022866 [Papaver armeniacum]